MTAFAFSFVLIQTDILPCVDPVLETLHAMKISETLDLAGTKAYTDLFCRYVGRG